MRMPRPFRKVCDVLLGIVWLVGAQVLWPPERTKR